MAEELKKTKAPLSVGLLAHVDAGKTTLSEAMLYRSDLRQKLSGCCVDLAQPWESLSEAAALCDEALLEALDTHGPEPKYPQDFIFLPDEALGIYSGPLRKMAAQLY